MIFKTGYFTASLLGANVSTLIDPKHLISRPPLLKAHVFDFDRLEILDFTAPSAGVQVLDFEKPKVLDLTAASAIRGQY